MINYRKIIVIAILVFVCRSALALERKDITFKVFQFPANMIPRIDGNAEDWSMVSDEYVIGTDQLVDDNGRHPKPDPNNLDVRVRVGWVKGMNRLYFLYEAYDNYWDFSLAGLHNDTFEVVVDADASGGPLIDKGHKEIWNTEQVGKARATPDDRISEEEANWAIHGVHAQNYHIFTPARGKDWTLAWGVQPWIKELPYANAACKYDFKPGESGRLVLEFWVTPFDYAGPEGPERAVESMLWENKIIGLCWAIIDYDDVNNRRNNGFWNLSRHHRMYGNASHFCAFKLMPLEKKFLKPIEAQWSFKVLDMDRRLVAFNDLSYGNITSWKWDFGDGESSTEQHPIHQYKSAGSYVVVLDIGGPDGKSRRSKVWDVTVK
ncbi:MAG: PKD domain-containing protein [Phycisphaerales bacterium]|jgi:hypothetical protein